MVLVTKKPLANAERVRDTGSSLGQEDPVEKEMAPHSSTLAWKIPWTEEPGSTVHRVAKSQTRLSNFASLQCHEYSIFH